MTLLPSVSTLIARGMFCAAKYTHHAFTPVMKYLITTTANKHPGKMSFTDKNMKKIPVLARRVDYTHHQRCSPSN